MRHSNVNRKFGREKNARRALLRSLAINLIEQGHIQTTEAKAKEIRPYVEKLVTLAKKNNLATRRLLHSKLGSGGGNAVQKLMTNLAPTYAERPGGYVRVIKSGQRIGSDGASMAIVEFV